MGKIVTVLDLIKFLSNVAGSIHAGKPISSSDHVLQEIHKKLSIGGLPAGIRNLLAISRVTLKGLAPLRESISD